MTSTVTRAPERRIHVIDPRDWGHQAGTDYWAFFGNLDMADAAGQDLDANGWITAGFEQLAGVDADLLSSSDVGVTGGFNFATASDAITSPFVFGDYAHGRMVEAILGYAPTSLNMECYARLAATNDENASGFGFIEAGGAAVTVADQLAYISSGGTTFELHSGAAEDAGATDDTDPHLWRITLSGTTAEWFQDGTSQGTITLELDLFPVAWSAGTVAAGANDPVVAWVHIWYS